MNIREDADRIIKASIHAALPDTAVKLALEKMPEVAGRIYLIAIGKAAWQMSKAAADELQDKIADGVCITKYDHVQGDIPHVRCYEAGHPVLDENSVNATREAEALVDDISADDMVVFLVSGGGSALFEDPLISLEELQEVNSKLLACGADITEINTLRKRLSRVKGGKFAKLCEPARVFSIILSDILGDPLDMIASGPAYPDSTSAQDALDIIKKYGLDFSDEIMRLMEEETPKSTPNVETHITGSVKQLCAAASDEAKSLGYEPIFLTACLDCVAREAGSFISAIAREHAGDGKNLAYIMGGETVVRITGKGRGGRNQEIALSAADGIGGLYNVCAFSVGSDGTDGPTDAAGGLTDGYTKEKLKKNGISIHAILNDNDSYKALQLCDGLVFTGPTGTNVNDITVLLIRADQAK